MTAAAPIDVTEVVPGAHLVLRGRLSATTIADVRTALLGAVDAGTGDLVVDLTQVELTDASGLGVLVGTHRRCDRLGRRLVLRGVPERIDHLLLATRLHRILHVDRRPTGTVDLTATERPTSTLTA